MENTEQTLDELMERFKFHDHSVQFHAHLAQRIGKIIYENHAEEAKKLNYFTEDFFNHYENTEEEKSK